MENGDYIKREDAERAIEEDIDSACMPYEWVEGMKDALDDLDRVPSADVVEVVRCKDCKYYKEYISHRGSAMMCFCPCCIGGQGKKNPTDYCSYGERKDNERF